MVEYIYIMVEYICNIVEYVYRMVKYICNMVEYTYKIMVEYICNMVEYVYRTVKYICNMVEYTYKIMVEYTQFYRIKGGGGSGCPPPTDNFGTVNFTLTNYTSLEREFHSEYDSF